MTRLSDEAVQQAQPGLDGVINRIVQAHDPEAFDERPMFPGARTTVLRPKPLLAIAAARLVATTAEGVTISAVREARGMGVGWQEIGEALGVEAANDYDLRVGAFEHCCPRDDDTYFRPASIMWTCGGPDGCGARVTDRGPYEADPENNESGHAAGCRRFAMAVQAARQGRDW